MLKEVGASGQISLGKKYAGQLFDMQVLDDGSVQLLPVKVVPRVKQEHGADLTADAIADVSLTLDNQALRKVAAKRMPERLQAASPPVAAQQATREWAENHATEIAQYNDWASQHEPYAQRVRRWRALGDAGKP